MSITSSLGQGAGAPPKPFPKLMLYKPTGTIWLITKENGAGFRVYAAKRSYPIGEFVSSQGITSDWEDYNGQVVLQNS